MMTNFETRVAKWLIDNLVQQGRGSSLVELFSMIRDRVEKVYTEDNEPTRTSYIQSTLDEALSKGNKHGPEIKWPFKDLEIGQRYIYSGGGEYSIEPIIVSIEEGPTKMVRFRAGHYPTRITDIGATATFKKVYTR